MTGTSGEPGSGDLLIGLGPRQELLYRVLLDRCRWRPADLAAELDLPVAEVDAVLDELHAEDLVVPSADAPDAVRAVEPRLALPALTLRRLRSGSGPLPAAIAVERFITAHEGPSGQVPGRSPDGHDAITVLTERLVARASREVLMLVPEHIPDSAGFSRHIAAIALRRDCALRTVWDARLLSLPPVVAHARWLGVRGATPRSAHRVPAHVVIVDRTVAVITADGPRAQVARPGPLLSSYRLLADRLWERAVDVREGSHPVHEPDDRPRGELVLQLLADGLTDEAIARRIGVSVRTVRTEVAGLMTHLNARSRFQAGMRAAQLGLP